MPSIVRVFWIAGNVAASVIVPVTSKLIVSLPVPAAQLLVAAFVLAEVIASCKLQVPADPVGSDRVLTVMVAARAVEPIAINISAVKTTADSLKRRSGCRRAGLPCKFRIDMLFIAKQNMKLFY